MNKTYYINTKAIKTIVILQEKAWAWWTSERPLVQLSNLAKALSAKFNIMAISTKRLGYEWNISVPYSEVQLLQDQVLNQDENLVNLRVGGLLLDTQGSKTILTLFPHCNNWSVGYLTMDVWDQNQILNLDTALGTESEDRGRIHKCYLDFHREQDNQKVENYLEFFRKVWELTAIISLCCSFNNAVENQTEVAGGRGPNSDPEVVWQTFVDQLFEYIQLAHDNPGH